MLAHLSRPSRRAPGARAFCVNRLPEARRYMERSIALDPGTDPLCYYNLALVYWGMNEPRPAEQAMRANLQRNPQDREAREMLTRSQAAPAPGASAQNPGDPTPRDRVE